MRDHRDELRAALGIEWPTFVRKVEGLLVQVARAPSAADSAAAMDEIFDTLLASPAGGLVQEIVLRERDARELRNVRGGRDGMQAAPVEVVDSATATAAASVLDWFITTKEARFRTVPVFFATDRARSGENNVNRAFGSDRGPLSFGELRISIPERHARGRIERPLPLFPESPEDHVALVGLRHRDASAFAQSLERAMETAGSPQALVFVHGYNVPFAEAARVAAQLASDVGFAGVPVLYSWPSRASFLGYGVDGTQARWTLPDFKEAMAVVGGVRSGALKTPTRRHVVAHSMGNRVVFLGLQQLEGERFGQVILAAPDEDAETMQRELPAFLGKAERNTLYAAKTDLALRMSRVLHGYASGGLAGAEGFDSIDATEVNPGFLGHSYFHEQAPLLDDIGTLLEHGTRPGDRPALEGTGDPGAWRFKRP